MMEENTVGRGLTMSIDSNAAITISFFAGIASVCWSAAFAWVKWLQYGHQPMERPELDHRLDRIEHAIDTVALEVERLGEGQRFTARLPRDATKAND
jgi:hypothetical protein